MAGSPTWEEVLASFEQTTSEAEALITRDAQAAAAPVVAPAYDPWQLAMPPLPDHLRTRAESVHARQIRVAIELEASMISLRQQEQIAGREDVAARAVYVDRRV
jgi:parvulin-like peptidyl-prolyl isomerase